MAFHQEAISSGKTVRMNQTLTINTTPAVLAATLAGAGLAVLPDFLAMEDIKAGRLTHILPAWTLPAGGIHAVYPAARFRPPKVTAFVAHADGGAQAHGANQGEKAVGPGLSRVVPDRLSSVEPLYGCAHNNFASSLTLECHKTFRRVWHRGFRAPRTTNGRFAPEAASRR